MLQIYYYYYYYYYYIIIILIFLTVYMYYFSTEATCIQTFDILPQTSHLLILKFARVFSDFPTSCIVMCAIRMLQV